MIAPRSPMLFISPISGAPKMFNIVSVEESMSMVNCTIHVWFGTALVGLCVSYPCHQSDCMVVPTFIYCFIAVKSVSFNNWELELKMSFEFHDRCLQIFTVMVISFQNCSFFLKT